MGLCRREIPPGRNLDISNPVVWGAWFAPRIVVVFVISVVAVISANLVTLFFSYSPLPGLIPHHHRPPPRESISSGFRSISSCFRVDFELRFESDSKRPKNDSKLTPWEGSRWWWGMSPWGVGCSGKTVSLR